MKVLNRVISGLLFVNALLLIGCTPVVLDQTRIPNTETLTATLTPTATTVWFPATATPTLLPTQERTPTPELKPGVGDLLVEDDFSDESAWNVWEIENGRVTLSNDHITLALNQPDGLIYGIRFEPQLKDFYAEITASPNFCQAEDEYGLMVRVNGTRLNHYRLVVSCSGQARVLRVINNRGNVVQDWVAKPFIPLSFPTNSRLGVWMKGTQLRFFINDRLVFELIDPVIRQGAFGVYVRGSGGGTISVNFSDLVIYQLESEE
jgi:hypothetical protein